jgi:hypothetical protein
LIQVERVMADVPDFLTVEETAKVLRIRRTAAYQLVNHDLATRGSDGLRARRFGRLIRVPRAALEELTGGPLNWPTRDGARDGTSPATSTVLESTPVSEPARSKSRGRQSTKRTRNRDNDAQLSLIEPAVND